MLKEHNCFLFCFLVWIGGCLFSNPTLAAPCCARGPAVPMLIMGTNRFQLNFGVAGVNKVAETDDQGDLYYGSPSNSERNLTYRIDFAGKVQDQLQFGFSLSYLNHFTQREGATESEWGWGDARVSAAYEFFTLLTDEEKLHSYFFSSMTLPTGRPIYYSQSESAADVTGDGFFTLTGGALFTKQVRDIDGFLVSELHYSFPRHFASDVPIQVSPGFGGSVGFGVGWSPNQGSVRIGGRVQPRVDQAQTIPQIHSQIGRNAFIAVFDLGIDVAWSLASSQTLMVSYIDQTLIEFSVNSDLNRIYVLTYQVRWSP